MLQWTSQFCILLITVFSGCRPRSGIAGSYSSFIFVFKEPLCDTPYWQCQFMFPPANKRFLFSTHLLQLQLFFVDLMMIAIMALSCGWPPLSFQLHFSKMDNMPVRTYLGRRKITYSSCEMGFSMLLPMPLPVVLDLLMDPSMLPPACQHLHSALLSDCSQPSGAFFAWCTYCWELPENLCPPGDSWV